MRLTGKEPQHSLDVEDHHITIKDWEPQDPTKHTEWAKESYKWHTQQNIMPNVHTYKTRLHCISQSHKTFYIYGQNMHENNNDHIWDSGNCGGGEGKCNQGRDSREIKPFSCLFFKKY